MKRSGLHLFASFLALCTFLLIVAGALVTSTGSGLAVPDWPLSFGRFFPPMAGGVFFEHGHRMVAGAVGLLTLALVIWVWRDRRGVDFRWLALSALIVVAMQAVLGGLTVLFRLPLPVSIAHAVLAQKFFCLTVAIALFTSPEWAQWRRDASLSAGVLENRRNYRALLVISIMTVLIVYGQLVMGAAMRHGAGRLFFLFHVAGAFFVTLGAASLFYVTHSRFRSVRELTFPASLVLVLLSAQILLGLTIITPAVGEQLFLVAGMRVAVVTLHAGTGALLLASSVVAALWSLRYYLDASHAGVRFPRMRAIFAAEQTNAAGLEPS